jgi:hypothetical protein
MFEQRFVELMKLENRNVHTRDEQDFSALKPVHFKPSLMDRVLPTLGEVMINIGLKLKDRPHARLNAEQAQSSNYMIML